MGIRKDYVRYHVDLVGLIELQDVPCDFDFYIETYPAEPTSWGQSRGMECDVSASLTSIRLGGAMLSAAKAEEIFGPDAIAAAEKVAVDRYMESGE
jgi:hypothetical protein